MEKAHLLRERLENRNNKGKVSTWSKSHDKRKCYHCHKERPFRKNCPKRKSKKNEASKKKGNVAMVLDGYDSTKVLRISTKNTKNEWVLDLGCTFHMCLIKTYLCDYQKLNYGSVYLGNNQAWRVIGMETIKIRSIDCTIRSLRNVWHVPNLKRNLISLRVLNDVGYWFKVENDSLKVLKGSLVIFKVDKMNGLYITWEEILNDSINVSISTISEDNKL